MRLSKFNEHTFCWFVMVVRAFLMFSLARIGVAFLSILTIIVVGGGVWREVAFKECEPLAFVPSLFELPETIVLSTLDVPAYAEPFHNRLGDPECCLDIAHAGGAYLGLAYSNSLESLERSYALGRRIFEIDFAPTCDGHIVLAHDWKYRGNRLPTLDEFRAEGAPGGLTALTLNELVSWLLLRPDTRLVTDTKFPIVHEALLSHLMAASHEEFVLKQVIFQAYAEQDIAAPEKRSYSQILTAYKLGNISSSDLVALAKSKNVIALTIPDRIALTHLEDLRSKLPEYPIYVHGSPEKINSREYQEYLTSLGASGFYLE